MIRTPAWKYTHRHPDGPHELYDMRGDPGETTNLADKPEYAEPQAMLRNRLAAFFDRYAEPRYDLTRGGTSKARRLLRE